MAERAEGVQTTTWRGIVAILLVASAAATQVPDGAWNGAAHFALVQSLAEGTPSIDEHLNQSGDIAYVDGRFYTAKAPGLALFSLPAYAVANALGAIPEGSPTSPPPGARYVSGRTIWNVNLVVVGAFFVLLLLIRWTVDLTVGAGGTAVALMLGLGTLLLPLATSYFSHDLAAALGFAAFALALRGPSPPSSSRLAAAGALAGLAVVAEIPAVIVAGAIAIFVSVDRPRLARLGWFAAGGVVGLLPLLAFNTWAFGSPLRTGYAHAVKEMGTTGHDVIGANEEGLFGVTHPDPAALVDLLVSERGLFVLTPIAALALAGLPGLARRGFRREALLVGGLTVAMLVYNASYYLPFGGNTPGPRFLVLLLPFLALPLADAWSRWRTPTLIVAAVSAFWMVSATIAGPLLPPGEQPTLWLTRIVDGRDLSGSIFAGGPSGAACFVVPALAAVALAAGTARAGKRWSRPSSQAP